MAKGGKGKSSASSATRKKQAAKAAKKFAFERDDDGNLLHPEAAEALLNPPRPAQRGQKKDKTKGKDKDKGKGKGKADKKKQFIPPPKPPQPLPDPLDSLGLASLLPADLVVLLRKASKKDVVTRCRALEGLLAWVQGALHPASASAHSHQDTDNTHTSQLTTQEKKDALVMMLPSWVHLFPRLALSPTRRLRMITMQIHALLLESPSTSSLSADPPSASADEASSSTRAELLQSPAYIEAILGPWAILCHDTDRSIERIGRSTWKNSVAWKLDGQEMEDDPSGLKLPLLEYLQILIDHLSTLLLSPSPSAALAMTAAHAGGQMIGSTPASASASGTTTPVTNPLTRSDRDAKNRDDTNVEEDSDALDKRLVAGALSVLSYLVTNHPSPKPTELLEPLLSSKLVWSAFSSMDLMRRAGKIREKQTTSFGFDAPAVRMRAWGLLRSLHTSIPDCLDVNVNTIATVAMSAAWQERDLAVQKAMLDALLPVLKQRPTMWLASEPTGNRAQADHDEDDGDDEEEDDHDEDDDEDDEDEDVQDESGEEASGGKASAHQPTSNATDVAASQAPKSYIAFLQWLQTGCAGSPALGYPAVLVFVSTLPQQILPSSSFAACSQLLTQLYSALYSRELDSDPAGARAFIACFCECTVFLSARMVNAADGKGIRSEAGQLAHIHLYSVWRELVLGISPSSDTLGTDDKQEADQDQSEEELKARAHRLKTIGEARLLNELGGSVRKLYNIDPSGHVPEPLLSGIEGDLTRIAQTASLSACDPAASLGTTETQAALSRSVSLLSGFLSPLKVQSATANRQNVLLDRAKDLTDKLLQSVAGSFEQSARAAANLDADSRPKLDVQVDLMAKLLRALSAAGQEPVDASLGTLKAIASASLPTLTTQRSISPGIASSFLAAYLPMCKDASTRSSIWSEVLSSVARLSSVSDQVEALDQLMVAADALRQTTSGAATTSPLPATDPSSGLDEVATSLAARLCESDRDGSLTVAKARDVVSRLMVKPEPFVDPATAQEMLALLTSGIEHLRYVAIDQSPASSTSEHVVQDRHRAATVLPNLLDCITTWLKAQPGVTGVRTLLQSPASSGVVAAVFDLAALLESDSASPDTTRLPGMSFARVQSRAAELWSLLSQTGDWTTDREARALALTSVREHLLDVQVPVDLIIAAAQKVSSSLPSQNVISVLPEAADLDSMLVRAAQAQPACTLSIVDPLVPQSDADSSVATAVGSSSFDRHGLSAYARCTLALLRFLKADRNLARGTAPSKLFHLVFFAQQAEDELLQRSSSTQLIKTTLAPRTLLIEIVKDAVEIATESLSRLAGETGKEWHANLISRLQHDDSKADTDLLSQPMLQGWTLSRSQPENAHLARAFGRLLTGCLGFSSVEAAEAEKWLRLGRSVSDSAPLLSQAVILAAKPHLQEASPVYDRLRNELAANLAGVPPAKASGEGLKLLRLIVAAAPSPEAETPMIPQQRAIFLLQALQKWLASDEELDEEINTRLAQLFVQLIPIVQDMPGSHVDFFFDLAESNLEVSSLSDAASLPGLYFTLRLVESLRDFAQRNANLRDVWKERKGTSLGLIRDLFLSLAEQQTGATTEDGATGSSVPRDVCAELLVDLVREVPTKSFDITTSAAPLCKLMATSPVQEVQAVSYRLLSASIKERISELVVETAVDKSSLSDEDKQAKLGLPTALIENLVEPLDMHLSALVEEESARRTALGYFLSWIAVLDHFEDASLALKSVFIGELERRELVASSLMPSVFALAGLVGSDRRPFDPSRWAIDEVYLDEVDPSSLTAIQLLASHVYLRALMQIPTLIRSWWLDIKDRQLSGQVTQFTTRYCTPIIASRELAHLKEPDALSTLQDEAMSVKVLSGNEVVATYVVDEHPMEIGVRIPPDFPLHGVEIRDIRRVGVNEAQWRAWLLAVQQMITGRNGLIFDALSLFKRNAEVKFQGMEECAICYSIISPMDRSLPTKPCKTCKNKFHAGCLFKWISTSGASTCPLCRSIL